MPLPRAQAGLAPGAPPAQPDTPLPPKLDEAGFLEEVPRASQRPDQRGGWWARTRGGGSPQAAEEVGGRQGPCGRTLEPQVGASLSRCSLLPGQALHPSWFFYFLFFF